VELGLASIPGFFGTSGAPGPASPYGVYWPALVPSDLVPMSVTLLGEGTATVDNTGPDLPFSPVEAPAVDLPPAPGGPTGRAPLGRVFGARSGDKGGNANVGIFARSAAAYAWLERFLTVERFQELLADTAPYPVERHELANLWSLNFVVKGLLEEGVAASSRQDGQAKGLGEYLRAVHVDLPAELMGEG